MITKPFKLYLTSLGKDAGPFDLYTDLDGYTTPIYTNIPPSAFDLGYFFGNMPIDADILRLQSTGKCINYIDSTQYGDYIIFEEYLCNQ